ncbi:MAG: discoidin domain-containing protein [Gemmatimonadaceae bacterium]
MGAPVSDAPRASVIIDATSPAATFDPLTALGSTIDGHAAGVTARIFTPENVRAMRSAGFHQISYRLRTELGVEAWHWNPRGRWSDAARQRGYWISDDSAPEPITVSHGYHLPRRGSTIDQANDESYSRIDDGDSTSFWKSNPYLDRRFTGEPNDAHPQWMLIDLGRPQPVNAMRIAWGVPFATRYEVQYWAGEQPGDADEDADGMWRTFPRGDVRAGHGGDVELSLGAAPRARWLRVLMYASSGVAPAGSSDVRDGLGYAVREIGAGRIGGGEFHDAIAHAPRASRQTRVYVSSTDPWHTAADRDDATEQPGIDLVFSSGITGDRPVLLPVGIAYDVPDNGAALLRYVRRRGLRVERIELGEEPDGQYADPRDIAALYSQAARALRDVDSTVRLGGPSFQSAGTDVQMSWKRSADERPWLTHFVRALQERGRLADFSFFSFEWYPFDDVCGAVAPKLDSLPDLLRRTLRKFRADGLPPGVPMVITEYGYSAFSGAPEMERAGALLNAESVALFLTEGGSAAFFYGTEPSNLDRAARCDSWGNNMLFVSDEQRRITAPNATLYAARMLTTLWADSAGGAHEIFRARVVAEARGAVAPVGAYALRRPGGAWSLMLVNRDPHRTWSVRVPLRAPLDVARLSGAEYEWRPNGGSGHASPNREPARFTLQTGERLSLPPLSLTVVRE